jgi:tetratricopeptide (TPR) repeat protein
MKTLAIFIILIVNLLAEGNTIKDAYLQSYNYEKVGRYKEAIKVLAPLYQQYPKGYTLNLRLAWLFYLNKNYNDSKKYYETASLIKPYSLEPKLGLAKVYLSMYEYEKAEAIGNQILKTDYYNYYGNLYTAKALIYQKKYNLAKNIINKMLQLYPIDVTYLEQLSIIYKATNNKYLSELNRNILVVDPNNTFVKSVIK